MPHELNDDHVVAICQVLLDHRVDFVIIGGVAARMHNTGHATIDIDVCPSSADQNLKRLSDALRVLGARLRIEGDVDGVAFDPHPDVLRQMTTMTLITDYGPLDPCFEPAGFPGGFASLDAGAVGLVVGGVRLPVAALADVVASKRAAGRPKDILALPALEARLRDE